VILESILSLSIGEFSKHDYGKEKVAQKHKEKNQKNIVKGDSTSPMKTTRKILHQQEKDTIVDTLLKRWESSEEPTVFFFPEIKKKQKPPIVAPFGILSSDWPGLSNSCIGVLHEKGWNISYIESFIIRHKKKELGTILLAIEIKNREELDKFFEIKSEIQKDLRVVATGSKAKSTLLAGETRKMEIYGHVIEKINGTRLTKSERHNILKDDGEAVKFFASRSESYLEERKFSDLAEVIVTNYRFLQKIRKSGGRPQFMIKNIKTSRENLTGITIVAFERDVSLNDWLEAIYQAVTDYTVKYNKEFVTNDGIVVYRIEICDGKQKSYSAKKIKEIKRALMKAHISRRMERVRWMELMGGFEHYMRAIIPLLVREYSLSRKSQVYISISQMTNLLAKFKILTVTGIELSETKGYGYKITEDMEKEKGISIISVKSPKKYGDVEVDIIDIGADLEIFSHIDEVYSIIRRSIKNTIGEFRDFDEGMRKLEVHKLETVVDRLKRYPENFVREFYYRLDDFYRIGADSEEVAEQIKLGIKGLETYEKGVNEYIVLNKVFYSKVDSDRIPLSTILVLVYPSKKKLLSKILEYLQEFEATLSRIERRDVTVVILRIQEENKPIPAHSIERIKKLFNTFLAE
jgi:hypothetical protein